MKRLLVLLVVSLLGGLLPASSYPAVVSNAYVVARNAGVYVNVFCTNESLSNGEELNFEMALLRNDIRQVMGNGPCYLDVNTSGRCGSSANVIAPKFWHSFKVTCDTHFRVSEKVDYGTERGVGRESDNDQGFSQRHVGCVQVHCKTCGLSRRHVRNVFTGPFCGI